MLRWLVWSFAAIAFMASLAAHVVHQRQKQLNSDYGRRFPFVAYEDGELLTAEDGRPMRFRTQEDAHRYEQAYKHPLGTVEGGRP